ncbi:MULTISPECIES: VC0807 family protein [Arthrobacter]|uniref:Uncharacterized protein n=1 Tax=Arthrobacter terricola TaxID=2547396 RepID=A0A4R5K5M0_9MICC|nr:MULTISPECIES: VC0807 family protein [Arthrobacter]MBT8163609.1 hypothetical protein [Arthrobacter sp. GN70]TDF88549.1 hypothetical protein E1809_23820 [Arthrobacter terricola]
MNAGQASGQERPVLMMRTLVRGLAWDVGLPLAVYYVLHLARATDWVALLAATGAAGCRLLWSALKQHVLNPFAMLMVIIFGLGLVLSFLTGDPRFLLLKDSAITGGLAIPRLSHSPARDAQGNTVLKTNGEDSLLVNTIGPYTGRHIIDTRSTSNTTQLIVNANAPWTITVSDVSTVKKSSGPVSGHGDDVRPHRDLPCTARSHGFPSSLLLSAAHATASMTCLLPPAIVPQDLTRSHDTVPGASVAVVIWLNRWPWIFQRPDRFFDRFDPRWL